MGLLLYNFVGYRFLYAYIQQEADADLEVRLDLNDYDEADLIEIKIPLNVPYLNISGSFERCEGEFEYGGKYYTSVKRKVSNDSITLLCIPNVAKETIQQEKNDFFKSMNDLSSKTQPRKSSNSLFKSLVIEYRCETNKWMIEKPVLQQIKYFSKDLCILSVNGKSLPDQPPEC